MRGSLMRGPMVQGCLLRGQLPGARALVTVKKIREKFCFVGVDPDHDPGLAPWFLERVADVAHYWLRLRHR